MVKKVGLLIAALTQLIAVVSAATHEFHWRAQYAMKNVDGDKEREVISCNGEFPWPDVRVKRGDRVIVHLENGLEDRNTSLHFHGMFQNGTNQMDGPEMVTQCPINPGDTMIYNFTVEHNKGTFWYHSHTMGQFQDGMKGLFIIEDDDFPYEYDEETALELSDWYHRSTKEIIPEFLSLYNPTGAEPVPQSLIMNNTRELKWHVKPNTTYLLRVANTGGFVSQYFWIEDHDLEVVEVDGVYVERNVTNMIYITSAQRYSMLVRTKSDTSKNFAIMQAFDRMMLDVEPEDLIYNAASFMIYDDEKDLPEPIVPEEYEFLDDVYLVPVDEHRREAYGDPDVSIEVTVDMDNLANGINYAFFNNITYVAPKVPTLMTVLSSGENARDPRVYGSNTHTYVYDKDEIVEIIINNHDTGRHPFHLHGRVFQVVARGPVVVTDKDTADDQETIEYDPDSAEFREIPMCRDTVYVEGKSWVVLRFKADNPGVWLFHCHIEWHMMQGLSLTLVEAPLDIQNTASQQLTDSSLGVCANVGMRHLGNAAGNSDDIFDLTGENVQAKAIPDGFTAKGIVAMFFSCLVAIIGLVTLSIYGLMEFQNLDGEDEESDKVKPGSASSISNDADHSSSLNKR
ncbi:HDR144Wp [Eremothecium sinecaudum]|uniref:HDR144Wp n=1 Tax=Eremothecium sinecaudum TaxID=45286 RepID=A0A0X8HSY7_9SACH|nr:HDR144Wp [Eremothecium sinecaudum]AMD20886.1 HDR144Wp [Eremothecium sinecaudum]